MTTDVTGSFAGTGILLVITLIPTITAIITKDVVTAETVEAPNVVGTTVVTVIVGTTVAAEVVIVVVVTVVVVTARELGTCDKLQEFSYDRKRILRNYYKLTHPRFKEKS